MGQPILSAAIASHATYLITGDYKDFGRYYGQSIANVTILPPAKYFSHYQNKPVTPKTEPIFYINN